jgi:hypothetical protein
MIVSEVVARVLYLGDQFWEDRWNLVDLLIVALCLVATLTEHVHIFGDEGQTLETATSIRILRDVVRSLRLFMFVRFLSDSIVAFKEAGPDHEPLAEPGDLLPADAGRDFSEIEDGEFNGAGEDVVL